MRSGFGGECRFGRVGFGVEETGRAQRALHKARTIGALACAS
jgi:hypothetical protein